MDTAARVRDLLVPFLMGIHDFGVTANGAHDVVEVVSMEMTAVQTWHVLTIELYERILGLEVDEPATPAERAAVLLATGLVHLNRGELDEAERLARLAKAMAIDAGLGHELGDAATLLAPYRCRPRSGTGRSRGSQS